MSRGIHDSLTTAGLADLSSMSGQRTVSSAEIVEFCLERIARLDPQLNAFVVAFEDACRRAAVAADADRSAGLACGPLHGIPIAVKDVFHCAGYPTRAGTRVHSIDPRQASAAVVQRLERAGMIVLGKTHTDEFAYGAWGANSITGTPWNPWDLDSHRVPGGSSSGSAVAVAACMAPAALGSDTGGSCRVPAAFCGCIGVKPSYGLIQRDGMVPLSPTFDVPGMLLRSVEDAMLLMDVLVDRNDHPEFCSGGTGIDINRLIIGKLGDRALEQVDADVLALYEAVLKDLEALGATILNFELPRPLDDYLRDTVEIVSAEINASFGALAHSKGDEIQPFVRARILEGGRTSADEIGRLLGRRKTAQFEMAAAMVGIDALVTPTCAKPAPKVADVDLNAPATPFARFVNYLNLAAVSVPAGLTSSRLPAAAQIVVRQYDDPLMLRIARALEKHRGGLFSSPPAIEDASRLLRPDVLLD